MLGDTEVAMLKGLEEELGFSADEMDVPIDPPVSLDSSTDDKVRLLEDTLQLFSNEGATSGEDGLP